MAAHFRRYSSNSLSTQPTDHINKIYEFLAPRDLLILLRVSKYLAGFVARNMDASVRHANTNWIKKWTKFVVKHYGSDRLNAFMLQYMPVGIEEISIDFVHDITKKLMPDVIRRCGKFLKKLSLCISTSGALMDTVLTRCPNITSLRLFGKGNGSPKNSGFDRFVEKHASLTHLALWGTNIKANTIKQALMKYHMLESFEMSGNTFDVSIIPVLIDRCVNLKRMAIVGPSALLYTNEFEIIASRGHRLEYLYIEQMPITKRGLLALADSNLKQLEIHCYGMVGYVIDHEGLLAVLEKMDVVIDTISIDLEHSRLTNKRRK